MSSTASTSENPYFDMAAALPLAVPDRCPEIFGRQLLESLHEWVRTVRSHGLAPLEQEATLGVCQHCVVWRRVPLREKEVDPSISLNRRVIPIQDHWFSSVPARLFEDELVALKTSGQYFFYPQRDLTEGERCLSLSDNPSRFNVLNLTDDDEPCITNHLTKFTGGVIETFFSTCNRKILRFAAAVTS